MNDNLLNDYERVLRLQSEGRDAEAIEAIEHILALTPDNAEFHYLHALLLLKINNSNDAIIALQKTVALNPKHSNAYNDMGIIYYKHGEYQNAFDNLRNAVLADRRNYKALSNMIDFLQKLAKQGQQIDPASVIKDFFNSGIYDISLRENDQALKRALVIYVSEAIPWYLADRLEEFPLINSHSMWWESAEILRLLNEHGYVVDWLCLGNQNILDQPFDWGKYDLIIDAGEKNLCKGPDISGQVKVFYSTGVHWLWANSAELNRLKMFYERHGIVMPPDRLQTYNNSDDKADYVTYFGTGTQMQGYNAACKKVQLNISSVNIPATRVKNIDASRKNFIWLGGQGMIHKGLDLAVDAFCEMPDVNLHIGAFMHTEPEFYKWIKRIVEKHKNILFYGALDVFSPQFTELAWNCIGTIYVSAAEGGPGSVAQLLHFGTIPIVSRSSNVRAEALGCIVPDDGSEEIIRGIKESVRSIISSPKEDLQKRCQDIVDFANTYHTREAYSKNFERFILEIEKSVGRATMKNHYVVNHVYEHLKPNDIRALHCGNISVVVTAQPLADCDIYLYLNANSFKGKQRGIDVLLLSEPMVVLPGQYDVAVWKRFDYVITIYDAVKEYVPEKFIKVPFYRMGGGALDADITEDMEERRRKYPLENRKNAICMINGNKVSDVPGELYSKRLEAANWFYGNSDIPFDIFGNPPFSHPNYKGVIPHGSKLSVLSQYKYNLCFENTNHPKFSIGYVEKIFDCLETRTIPIYLGAPDIKKYVPGECFIDFRDFKSYEELNDFIHNIDEDKYLGYIGNIDKWVADGGLRPYTWDRVYDEVARVLASRLSLDLAALFGGSAKWEPGASASFGNIHLDYAAGDSIWTWEFLAHAKSPLAFAGIAENDDTSG